MAHRIEFSTPDPADHICRALDVMRKMCFELIAFRLSRNALGEFAVGIEFLQRGSLSAEILVHRFKGFIGTTEVVCIDAGPVHEIEGVPTGWPLAPQPFQQRELPW